MCPGIVNTQLYDVIGEEMMESLRRFTAGTHAGHLLPHLRPGRRILDFGCGPRSISVGLAQAVHPGELHGVDMEESQIDLAREVAQFHRQDNAVFHVGDVTALEFEDGLSDVAHCHNLLMHVPDAHAVLTEVKRVLKPGGLIACREMICESSFVHPDMGIMETAWNALEDLLTFDDGHPQMGRVFRFSRSGNSEKGQSLQRLVAEVSQRRRDIGCPWAYRASPVTTRPARSTRPSSSGATLNSASFSPPPLLSQGQAQLLPI